MAPSVEYLGHVIDKNGLHPTRQKVKAIEEARFPTSVTELRVFFGLLNNYSKFLPNLASKLSPLHKLLYKTTEWTWGRAQRDVFGEAKRLLPSDSLLVHFDENKPLISACDASPYRAGAVLSHVMEDKSERPIAYASRTLAVAEKDYSQLDKETVAIAFGVKRFHPYLYGRHFIIRSDHQLCHTSLMNMKVFQHYPLHSCSDGT